VDRSFDDFQVLRPLDFGQRRGILDVAQNEIQIGMTGVRLRDRLGAEIDAAAGPFFTGSMSRK
jgi:hypothetical protein